MKGDRASSSHAANRGFSLVEILLAVGILGIGLVMVATVFPVGADWTRRGVDDSLAQTVAQDALAVLQAHYPVGSANANSVVTQVGQANQQLLLFPNINAAIPIDLSGNPSERCYKFGSAQAFPGDPATANYFWTALIRSTQTTASTSQKFDVYILVFRKGAVGQQFTSAGSPAGSTLISGAVGADPSFPSLALGAFNAGTYNKSSGRINNALPAIGEYGIGQTSGTVFRQYVDPLSPVANQWAAPRPQLLGPAENASSPQAPVVNEQIIFAPAADGTNASTLVYVFQTTMSF